mmetsp:Transcript_9938/g.33736  ORF Transcript_9938/g.33736 Transcript_9938/m.33736 type:complete len:250 (-) Transcript_9938:311-1060(-)
MYMCSDTLPVTEKSRASFRDRLTRRLETLPPGAGQGAEPARPVASPGTEGGVIDNGASAIYESAQAPTRGSPAPQPAGPRRVEGSACAGARARAPSFGRGGPVSAAAHRRRPPWATGGRPHGQPRRRPACPKPRGEAPAARRPAPPRPPRARAPPPGAARRDLRGPCLRAARARGAVGARAPRGPRGPSVGCAWPVPGPNPCLSGRQRPAPRRAAPPPLPRPHRPMASCRARRGAAGGGARGGRGSTLR